MNETQNGFNNPLAQSFNYAGSNLKTNSQQKKSHNETPNTERTKCICRTKV